MGDHDLIEDIELSCDKVYTVGRNSNSSISLNIEDVSGKHAEFGFSDNAWNIIDCNSTNGVYINGEKISIHKLSNGDQIQLGSALFRYQEGKVSTHRLPFPVNGKFVAFSVLGVLFLSAGIFLSHSYQKKEPALEKEEPVRFQVSESRKQRIRDIPGISRDELVLKRTTELKIYYDAENKNVLIFDFPNLHQNGLMFNRMLAFVEGPGVTRDALLCDRDLLKFIEKRKLTFETFSFGNDFSVKDMVTFFNLAKRSSVNLNREEIRLRNILLDQKFMKVGPSGEFSTTPVEKAVISITQLQPDDPSTDTNELIDIDIRRALLMHEMSHGEFYTNKAYRDYCKDFWYHKMSERERDAFKKMLMENSYDVTNEVLCINEMQAYLMNTPDKRLFSADSLGISEDELTRMRQKFISGDPPAKIYDSGWFRYFVSIQK